MNVVPFWKFFVQNMCIFIFFQLILCLVLGLRISEKKIYKKNIENIKISSCPSFVFAQELFITFFYK